MPSYTSCTRVTVLREARSAGFQASIYSSPSLNAIYQAGVIFIISNLAWLEFDILPLSGFQGNRAKKLTKGQILMQKGMGV